jgi:hypothetical protein
MLSLTLFRQSFSKWSAPDLPDYSTAVAKRRSVGRHYGSNPANSGH